MCARVTVIGIEFWYYQMRQDLCVSMKFLFIFAVLASTALSAVILVRTVLHPNPFPRHSYFNLSLTNDTCSGHWQRCLRASKGYSRDAPYSLPCSIGSQSRRDYGARCRNWNPSMEFRQEYIRRPELRILSQLGSNKSPQTLPTQKPMRVIWEERSKYVIVGPNKSAYPYVQSTDLDYQAIQVGNKQDQCACHQKKPEEQKLSEGTLDSESDEYSESFEDPWSTDTWRNRRSYNQKQAEGGRWKC